MGLFSSITKLFQKDAPASGCCEDGICTCSSADITLVEPPPSVVPVEEPSVTVTADEINIALETAAEADRAARLDAEEDFFYVDVQPDPPARKKKTSPKKSTSKLPRKSKTKRKRN